VDALIAVEFSIAALTIRGDPTPMTLYTDPANSGIFGAMNPAISPILGKYHPGHFEMWIGGGWPPAQTGNVQSLFTSWLVNPPSTYYCLAFISGDCDLFGELKPVSVTHRVPEPGSLVHLLPAVAVAVPLLRSSRTRWRRKRSEAAQARLTRTA
jgi:hypothetical protein